MEKKRYRTGGNLGSFENDTDEVWANGDKKMIGREINVDVSRAAQKRHNFCRKQ